VKVGRASDLVKRLVILSFPEIGFNLLILHIFSDKVVANVDMFRSAVEFRILREFDRRRVVDI
jgi:hypothetical protein